LGPRKARQAQSTGATVALIVVVVLVCAAFLVAFDVQSGQFAVQNSRNDTLMSSLASENDSIGSLSLRIQTIEGTIAQQSSTISKQSAIIAQQSAAIAQQSTLISQQSAELASQNGTLAQIAQVTKTISGLDLALANDSRALSSLELTLSQQSQGFNMTINQLLGEITSMQTKIAALQNEVTSLQSQVTALVDQVQGVSTLGFSSTTLTVADQFQRKLFQADGLYWAFYSNGTSMVYTYSGDGQSWAAPTAVRPQDNGVHFATWYDSGSNTLYYVSDDGSTSGFWYRWGAPESNGSISWAIPEGFVTAGQNAAGPYIYGKGSTVWVSLLTDSGAYVEVWLYSAGAWTRADLISTIAGSGSIIVPLSTGVAVLYCDGYETIGRTGPVWITITTDSGAHWSSPVKSQSQYIGFAAVSVGSSIYVAGEDGSSDIRFFAFNAKTLTFTPEVVLASGFQNNVISTDGASTLVIAYGTDGGSIGWVVSHDLGTAWSAPETLNPSGTNYVGPPTAPYLVSGNQYYLAWIQGTGPYAVLWKEVTIP